MVTKEDLLFTPTVPTVPIWKVTIGGREIATVEERAQKIAKYLVSISGRTDRVFDQREYVMNYILNSLY
jgi:hypothetical protein